MSSRQILPLVAITVVIPALFPPPAHAYLDPASLTFILQSIVAAFVGAAIYMRLSWDKVKERARSLFGSSNDGEDD